MCNSGIGGQSIISIYGDDNFGIELAFHRKYIVVNNQIRCK